MRSAGLAVYRRGHLTDYWVTMAQAAQLLGIARQHAHKARLAGRLPAQQTGMGDWLVRRNDVTSLVAAEAFRGRR